MMREIFLEFLTPTKLSEYFFSPEANVLLRKKEDFSFHQAYLLRVFLEGHLSFIEQKKIEFSSDFSISEIKDILKDKLFYLYFKARMEIPVWTEFEFATQKKALDDCFKEENFFQYGIIRYFLEFFPYSVVGKAKEEGKKRFYLYTPLFTQEQKGMYLSFLQQLDFGKEILEVVGLYNLRGSEQVCFSLIWEGKKLIRKSFYILNWNDGVEKKKILSSLFFDSFSYELNISQMIDLGIDEYEKKTEIKLYLKNHLFCEHLENKDLEKVLLKKSCRKILRLNPKGVLVNSKYEFFTQKFSEQEKKVLFECNLIDNTTRIFSIYLSEKKVIKTVAYDI
ncbi:MAG: hypothetical protein H6500_01075 [Candidatus Woesearchaeota archaeon]|nr:MAG: hypothetical protein H6500_01075 [Candidatus Woesearchaeota archaeon]